MRLPWEHEENYKNPNQLKFIFIYLYFAWHLQAVSKLLVPNCLSYCIKGCLNPNTTSASHLFSISIYNEKRSAYLVLIKKLFQREVISKGSNVLVQVADCPTKNHTPIILINYMRGMYNLRCMKGNLEKQLHRMKLNFVNSSLSVSGYLVLPLHGKRAFINKKKLKYLHMIFEVKATFPLTRSLLVPAKFTN